MELPSLPNAQRSAQDIRCPKCLYDLSDSAGLSGDAVTCPECGIALTMSSIKSRSAATVSTALAMIGWGALAIVAAEMLGVTAASFVNPLLDSQNRTIRSETIALPLQFLPQIIVACGAGALGWATARTRHQRGWSVGVAAAFVLSLLYAKTITNTIWSLEAFGDWRQPQFWQSANMWILGITTWLAIWMAAQALGRAIGSDRSAAWRRVVLALCVAAGVGLCLTVLLRFAWSIFPMPGLYKVGEQTKNYDTMRDIGNVLRYAEVSLQMVWWIAWIGLALAAFFVRILLNAEKRRP